MFLQSAASENLAANINKGFASYYNPVDQQQLLLLDIRKISTTDKVKSRTLEIKIQEKENADMKSAARAKLPPSSDKSSTDYKELPASRKRILVNYAEDFEKKLGQLC